MKHFVLLLLVLSYNAFACDQPCSPDPMNVDIQTARGSSFASNFSQFGDNLNGGAFGVAGSASFNASGPMSADGVANTTITMSGIATPGNALTEVSVVNHAAANPTGRVSFSSQAGADAWAGDVYSAGFVSAGATNSGEVENLHHSAIIDDTSSASASVIVNSGEDATSSYTSVATIGRASTSFANCPISTVGVQGEYVGGKSFTQGGANLSGTFLGSYEHTANANNIVGQGNGSTVLSITPSGNGSVLQSLTTANSSITH